MLRTEDSAVWLTCPGCSYSSQVPDESLPPAGSRGRCGTCGRRYLFDGMRLVDEDPTPVNPLDPHSDEDSEVRPRPPTATIPLARPPEPPPPPAPPPAAAAAAGPTGTASAAARSAPSSGQGPKPLADGWLVKIGLQPAGPFTGQDVKTRIRKGELAETQEVMPPGTENWVLARDVPDLQRYFALRRSETSPKPEAGKGDFHCTKHPTLKAEWGCATCQTTLCNPCTVIRDMGPVRNVRTCSTCGNACHPVKAEEIVVPFWQDIPGLLRFPVWKGGWIAIIVCALFQGLRGIPGIGLAAWFIIGACLLAYHLFILRSSAYGAKDVPNLAHVENLVDEMIIPGAKAMFVSLVVIVPLAWHGLTRLAPAMMDAASAAAMVASYQEPAEEETYEEEYSSDGESGDTYEDSYEYSPGDEAGDWQPPPEWGAGDDAGWTPPEGLVEAQPALEDLQAEASKANTRLTLHVFVFLGLCLYALVAWPILLIIVAIYNTVAPAFNPVAVVQVLQVIKTEYAIGLVFLLVIGLIGGAVQVPFAFIPYAGAVLGALVGHYFSFMSFHVMGRMAQMAQAKLGW